VTVQATSFATALLRFLFFEPSSDLADQLHGKERIIVTLIAVTATLCDVVWPRL